MQQLLSVSEYARREGITTQAVYKKIHSGKLKVKREKVERVKVVVEEDGLDVK